MPRTQSAETAALRFGAVLAASGPVILTAFGIGRESTGWFCSGTNSGPYAPQSASWELLFWAELLLPVLLAALLLRGPRRATLLAVSAVGAVLALGLFTAVLLPAADPCTGHALPVTLPWPLIFCYPVAAVSLILAARSPLPPARHGVVIWVIASAAAAWTAATSRLPATIDKLPGHLVEAPEPFWYGFARWASEAETIGLPIVIVALGAAAKGWWGRLGGIAAGGLLLLFALLDVVACVSQYGSELQVRLVSLIKWPLLLAALLVLLATWSRQGPGTVRPLRGKIPGQPKDLAILIVVLAGALWLVVTSFSPSSP
ncbi:hypothetical protein [Nonomuraea sp. NPDC046570]|uniref:hypothetical protein n=1 Tax=Nonomuraea sp. NPDC046570 TaxID=3155255 RepID=UPI0033F1FF3E